MGEGNNRKQDNIAIFRIEVKQVALGSCVQVEALFGIFLGVLKSELSRDFYTKWRNSRIA